VGWVLGNVFQKNYIMQVNLFFDWLSNGELLTLKTGPPCIWLFRIDYVVLLFNNIPKRLTQ